MIKKIIRVTACVLLPFNLAMSVEEDGNNSRNIKRARSVSIDDSDIQLINRVQSARTNVNIVSADSSDADSDGSDARLSNQEFYFTFNPGRFPEKVAEKLSERGIRTDSTQEEVQKEFKSCLIVLVREEGLEPIDYVAQITMMLSIFEDRYNGLIKPYILIAEEDAAAAAARKKRRKLVSIRLNLR